MYLFKKKLVLIVKNVFLCDIRRLLTKVRIIILMEINLSIQKIIIFFNFPSIIGH